MANFDELDLDFELDAPLGGGGRPSELTSDPRADEWAAAATTTHRIGHVRDISLADDEEDFAAASLGSRSVAGDDVVGRARRGGPGSDVSSIEIMRGAEDRESNPLSVGGRDSDRFLGRPDDDDAGLVDMVDILAVAPGRGGQSFDGAAALPKLRALREKYPDLRLQVDGGIDASTCSDAVEAGADVLVAGSYIFRAGDAAEAVAALREAFPPEASPRGKRWPWQR